MSRFARKVDDNQEAIVKALRAFGCSVQSLAAVGSGCPDLLVGRRALTQDGGKGTTYLLEVKDGKRHSKHKGTDEAQALWHARWKGGPLHVVHSIDEALACIGLKETP